MISQEIIAKIKNLEIETRRRLRSFLIGMKDSREKGYGLEFDQLREYQFGDDVRFIDWKSSARADKFLVKQYRDDRSRTINILVDISGSSFFGSGNQIKYDALCQLAITLAFVAYYARDAVGLVLFSDTIELIIPPRIGLKHIHLIMEKLLTHKPQSTGTNSNVALEYLAKSHNASIAFFLSDCIDQGFEKLLKIVAQKHDLMVIRCLDHYEQKIPEIGFLSVKDIETGQTMLLDTRNQYKNSLASFMQERFIEQEKMIRQHGADVLTVITQGPFIDDVVKFLYKRKL